MNERIERIFYYFEEFIIEFRISKLILIINKSEITQKFELNIDIIDSILNLNLKITYFELVLTSKSDNLGF